MNEAPQVEMALYGLHWALGLTDARAHIVQRICEEYEIDPDTVREALAATLQEHGLYDDAEWTAWLNCDVSWNEFKAEHAQELAGW